jgi:hypothetical protein
MLADDFFVGGEIKEKRYGLLLYIEYVTLNPIDDCLFFLFCCNK